jgi:hypothetical protein
MFSICKVIELTESYNIETKEVLLVLIFVSLCQFNLSISSQFVISVLMIKEMSYSCMFIVSYNFKRLNAGCKHI